MRWASCPTGALWVTTSMVVPPEHALLVVLLENLLDRFGGPHANAARPLFDDAAWVGFRLAELLPFANGDRQALLQCGDAHDRLDRIVHALPDLRACAS